MQRVRNSVNMNQLKISWNVHFVNDVFCDNVDDLSMHELQINLVTIRRFKYVHWTENEFNERDNYSLNDE
jgi:hypothetical protein